MIPKVEESKVILAATLTYTVLFFIGFAGNVTVMLMVAQICRFLQETKDSIFIFIIWLSLVDLSVIMALPMAIIQLIFGHWAFGQVLCKIYWILESTGKGMSIFVLTALSFDRYMAICHPQKVFYRSRKFYIILLTSTVIVAASLMAPLPIFAGLVRMESPVMNVDGTPKVFYREKCITFGGPGEDGILRIFVSSAFVVAYLLPFFCLLFFYTSILQRIHNHAGSTTFKSTIPVRKITLYITGLLAFHFLTWSPYWILMLNNIIGYASLSDSYLTAMYFVHTLPFINSAFNWVFYACLNTQFREAYAKVTSELAERATLLDVSSELIKKNELRPARSEACLADPTASCLGIVDQLAKLLPVDKLGGCGNFTWPRDSRENYLFSQYKFVIAFENSVCTDYVTEKFFRLQHGAVPIVLRRSDYEEKFPKNSFIAADDFASLKSLANYLAYLHKHPVKYLELLEWRKTFHVGNEDCMKKG